MCLNPVTIVNPARNIAVCGGQQLRMSVNCNHCAECLNRKRDEYSFRMYWHTRSCIDNGGYVLFDTLTYSDKFLPHLSDFVDTSEYGITDTSCFNRQHYKLFFKRLRRRIQVKYGLTSAITYFFASEYGVDDRYTHRPHYHPLIFVHDRRIHPVWLSYTISECWPFGRTDGLKFKPLSYVAKHVYGYDLGFGSNDTSFCIRAVTHYVAKYVNKSSEFQTKLDMRIKHIELCLSTSEKCEQTIKDLLRQVSMFHLHSQGFGLAYLDYVGDREREALLTDECILPDKDKVVKTLPLPMYYIRKLYYITVRENDKVYWQLTGDGVKHKIQKQIKCLDKKKQYYEDLYSNCTEEQKSFIDTLLDGRSLFDYSVYMQFYYGRLRHYTAVNYYTGTQESSLLSDEELDSFLPYIEKSFDNNIGYSYITADDRNDVFIENTINKHPDPVFPRFVLDKTDFVDKYCFSQQSDYRFRHYDVLTSFFNHVKRLQKQYVQSTYEQKKRIAETLRSVTNVKFN